MKKQLQYRLVALLSMAIFGTVGIFRRWTPLPSGTLSMMRGYIGTVALLLFMLVCRKKINFAAIKKNFLPLLLSGGFIGINWILLFESYRYTTVAIATLCYYTAPILVILAAPFVLKQKLNAKKIIATVMAAAGIVLISGVLSPQEGTSDFRGILFGLGAAVFYASVMLTNQRIRDISSYDKTVMQLFFAATVVLPYVFLVEKPDFASVTFSGWWPVFVMGVVHTGFAYVLYFYTIDKMPAQTFAMLSYADPVVAVLISPLLLSESLTVFTVVGMVLILGGTVLADR